jgi:hypothetical protein
MSRGLERQNEDSILKKVREKEGMREGGGREGGTILCTKHGASSLFPNERSKG